LAFWQIGSRDPHLPGLWDFRSATVGDGLLLPALLGGLMWAAVRLGSAGAGEGRWPFRAALAGATIGVGSQIVWLSDPHPRGNWTFPKAGEFTAAGWYHAAFLVATCGALAASIVFVLIRWRARQRQDAGFSAALFSTSAPILFLAIGLAYVWLLLHDSVDHGVSAASGSSVAGVLLAVAVLIILVRVSVGVRPPLTDLGFALVGSAGLSAFILGVHRNLLGHAAVAAFCGAAFAFGALWPVRLVGDRRWTAFSICASAALAGALTFNAGQPHVALPALQALLALVLLPLLLRAGKVRSAPGLELWIAVMPLCLMIALAPWVGSGSPGRTAAKYSLGLAAVLLQLIYLVIERYYSRAASFAKETESRKPEVPATAVSLLMLGCGAMVAYFSFVVPVARAAGFESKTSTQPWAENPWVMMVVVLALGGAALLYNTLGRRASQAGPAPAPARIQLSPVAAVLASTGSIGWIATMAATFRIAPGLSAWYVGATLAAALLLGVLTTESVISSSAVLQAVKITWSAIVVAVLAGLAVCSSVLWLTLSGVWSFRVAATLPAALGAMAVAYGGGYGTALLSGITVASGCRVPPATEDPPVFNVIQDQLLYCGLGSFAVWTSATAFARAPQPDGRHLLSAATQLATFMGPFALLFVFTLFNNAKHLKRQPERIRQVVAAGNLGRPLDEEAWVRNLRRHIQLQAFASVGLAVVSIAGFAATFLATLISFFKLLLDKSPSRP
jgi:hypothetical protein